MANRLPGLEDEAYTRLNAELTQMSDRMAEIGNIIGPAFGAAWCDKALRLYHNIHRLRLQIEDRHYDAQDHRP
jgi:hypothetical protein